MAGGVGEIVAIEGIVFYASYLGSESLVSGISMRHIIFGIISLSTIDAALADKDMRPRTFLDGPYGGYNSPSKQYRLNGDSAQSNVNPHNGERDTKRQEFTNPPPYNAYTDRYARPHGARRDSTHDAHSEPNQHRIDTSSAGGNVNPYTGVQGARPQESANPNPYNTDHSSTRPDRYPYGLFRSRSR
jgi:hypothetical protein